MHVGTFGDSLRYFEVRFECELPEFVGGFLEAVATEEEERYDADGPCYDGRQQAACLTLLDDLAVELDVYYPHTLLLLWCQSCKLDHEGSIRALVLDCIARCGKKRSRNDSWRDE